MAILPGEGHEGIFGFKNLVATLRRASATSQGEREGGQAFCGTKKTDKNVRQ